MNVCATSEYVQFVCDVSESAEVSAAVRGIALTVLSATVRCLPHTNPLFFRPIAVSLVENLKYASELIKEPVLQTTVSPADIIIHQCVEILMSVGESKVKWVDSARVGICIAGKLLQQCIFSDNVLASKQRIVDTTKIYGMIAEIWMLHSEPSEVPVVLDGINNVDVSESVVLMYTCPSIILKFLMLGDIVHDSFLSAFQLSIDVAYTLEERSCKDLKDEWGFDMVREDINMRNALSSVFEECLTLIKDASIESSLTLKRIEVLIGFISSFYENYGELKRHKGSISPPAAALQGIIDLQQRMKDLMISFKTKKIPGSDDSSLSMEDEKDIRICCSDIRKGCISTTKSIILACPFWVIADTERYWSLCTVSLSTPLLFSAGYQATKHRKTLNNDNKDSNNQIDSTSAIIKCSDEDLLVHDLLTRRMLKHIISALKNVNKYSSGTLIVVLLC
jgi:hypothetical protein